jgi:hypothetical protein
MGTFEEVMDVVYPLAAQPVQIPHPQHAHNLFLQIAVDFGLPGLLGGGAVERRAARMTIVKISKNDHPAWYNRIYNGTARLGVKERGFILFLVATQPKIIKNSPFFHTFE